MNDKDKIIALLQKQLQDALSKNRALEQEVALLNNILLEEKTENNYSFGFYLD